MLRRISSTLVKGQSAEAAAEQFLLQHGLRTRCKNYRCRVGEIDLVMQHDDVLVFVEVRLRTNSRFSSAAESVDGRKQLKIARAAQFYLQQHQLTDRVPCRFDVVALQQTQSEITPDWIRNAFGC